ncbi:signal peptide protein, toluene tolerance protein Ttg2D (plasmid) [Legionella adelaidensis]|uniref:Toluene tolerance protein Ttg2D n=1 Tax=Legionella adelaidensis TaxID=45056 RepID=A0A0W0R3V6_9GAMM|nr:ABC transporter substrate-binding protein [Legionella adelaidensis]KTC65733.1 toluene tolerance protein Ttg2D [Legionella adelaidensis]VEH85101.1 signal peptide protein, toluene tolerance protein Ttg2D [Legionella adelaidensis]
MKTLKTLLLTLALGVSTILCAQDSPVPMLENVANQIINTLNQNKGNLKNNHAIIHQAVTRYLLPVVDVTGMSRSVLGRQAWNQATSAQKKEFTQEFTKLVIRTYSTPLAEYSDEKVKFLPLRGATNGKFIRVNSVISRSNGQNIPLSYSLVSKNGQWKIYDLSVEGVSLLQSFRSQFGQILQNSSMDELINQMRKKAA